MIEGTTIRGLAGAQHTLEALRSPGIAGTPLEPPHQLPQPGYIRPNTPSSGKSIYRRPR